MRRRRSSRSAASCRNYPDYYRRASLPCHTAPSTHKVSETTVIVLEETSALIAAVQGAEGDRWELNGAIKV